MSAVAPAVGIIGLGIMGGAIARNLAKAGHAIVGYDVDASRAATLPMRRGLQPPCSSLRRSRDDRPDRLVEAGIPFRQAHEIVGKLVACAHDSGVPLDKLDSRDFLAGSATLTPDVVALTFDLECALKARKATGAPSPENVARELARWSADLE